MNEADYKTYLFSYKHAGARWSFEIMAKDPQDAKARIAKLIYAEYDGQVFTKIPVSCGAIARLVAWIKTLFRHNLLPDS